MGIDIVEVEKSWTLFLRIKTRYRVVEMAVGTCLPINLNSINNGKVLLLITSFRLIERVSGRLLLRREGNSLRKQTKFAAPPLVSAQKFHTDGSSLP